MGGFRKRNCTIESHFRPTNPHMEWRPGAATGKRKKISREHNLHLISHSLFNPVQADASFLKTLQANALRTISVQNRERLPWLRGNSNNWLQIVGNHEVLNRKRQLEIWDFPGFSREKMRLLNEIEALIDSEENALNMEASAKAAEGRLRSLLDICICNQCQENLENRNSNNSNNMLSTRTNGCRTSANPTGCEENKFAENTTKPKQKFFLSNIKEAMERDKVALDEFLHKQKIKHEISKKELEEVKFNFKVFFNKYMKDAEVDKKPVQMGYTMHDVSADARKLHETINKLLNKNRQLQAMLSGRDNVNHERNIPDIDVEHIREPCNKPWETRAPRIFNYSRKCFKVNNQSDGCENMEEFPQGYSYLYVSPAFEDENIPINSNIPILTRRAVDSVEEQANLNRQNEMVHSHAQNFCPKFKLSSVPALCSSFTQTCEENNITDMQTAEDVKLGHAKPTNTCETTIHMKNSATKDDNSVLIDIIRKWRMQALVPRDLLENRDSCTQTSMTMAEVGHLLLDKSVVERVRFDGQLDKALLNLSLICQEEETKLGMEQLDVKLSYESLVKTMRMLLHKFCNNHEKEELLEASGSAIIVSNGEYFETVEDGKTESLQTELLEASQNEQDMRTIVNELTEELTANKLKVMELENCLTERDEALKSSKSIAEESQGDAQRKMWELSECLAKISSLEGALEENSLRAQEMSEALESAKFHIEESQRDFERRLEQERNTASKDCSEQFQSRLNILRNELVASQQNVAVLERAMADKDAHITMVENGMSRKSLELQKVEFRLKEMENSKCILTRQLEDARNSVKEMVQILGTERMNNVEKAAALEEVIAKKNTMIGELEIKDEETEKLKSMVEIELKKATENVKGLQATLSAVKTDHSKAEQSLSDKITKLQQMETKVLALEFENFQLKGRYRELDKQSNDHKQQFNDLVSINEELLKFAQEKENQLNAYEKKVSALQLIVDRKTGESSRLMKEIENMQLDSGHTHVNVLKERYKAMKQGLADAEFEIGQRDDAIERLSKSLGAAVESENVLLQEAEQLNVMLKNSQYKEHELNEQVAQFRMEKLGLEETIRGLERKLVLVRVEMAELNAQNAALKKVAENKDKDIMQMNKEVEQLRAKGQILEEDILEKEGQIAILKESFGDDNSSTWLKG